MYEMYGVQGSARCRAGDRSETYEAQEWRALDKGALDRFGALLQRFTSAAITGQYLSLEGRRTSADARRGD